MRVRGGGGGGTKRDLSTEGVLFLESKASGRLLWLQRTNRVRRGLRAKRIVGISGCDWWSDWV